MSWGTGPFGTTALGVAVTAPSTAERATFASSRKIDPETMTYVEDTDGNGGFDGMPDSLQRVLLAITFDVHEPPIIDARFEAIMRSRIAKALIPLTSGPEPAIRVNKITVSNDGKSGTTKIVAFYDYASATTQSVQAN